MKPPKTVENHDKKKEQRDLLLLNMLEMAVTINLIPLVTNVHSGLSLELNK